MRVAGIRNYGSSGIAFGASNTASARKGRAVFRCSAHPAGPSELRFSELGFLSPGIMGVGSWLVGGRLVGWLAVGCWLSLLCPLVGGLLVGCCWLSVVDWWAVVGQPP